MGLDIRLTDVTVALAELGAHVDIWSGITGWPANEIWLLLSVSAGVTALIATFVTYRVCRGLLMFLFPEREHCHPCAKDAERRIDQQREAMRKAWVKLWNRLTTSEPHTHDGGKTVHSHRTWGVFSRS